MERPAVVLVADDSRTVRTLVSRIMAKAGFHVLEAEDGLEALATVVADKPDVAVLDHNMPGCTGLEVIRRLVGRDDCAGTAFLLLTSEEDGSVAADALGFGAEDFVRKPCEPAELAARVRKIVEHQRIVADLDRRSATDQLTGLPNRRGMAPVLDALGARRGSGLGLLVVDIDHFKAVNDSFGHDVGDLVIRTVAGRLAGTADPFTVSRWGGEEFLVAGRCDGAGDLAELGEQLRRAIAATSLSFDHGGREVTVPVTVSIGAVLVDDGGDVDDAFRLADAALYEAKAAGRDRVVVAGAHPGPVVGRPAGAAPTSPTDRR